MEFVPEELNYNENEPYKAYVGIRPEGFVIDPNGKFTLHVEQVEVMGRDISIIVSHPNCEKPTARIIVDASEAKGITVGEDLKFSLKPGKIFVFDGYTEERLKIMEGLNTKKAWLFLAPTLILMAIFTFYPLIQTMIYSFLNGYNGMGAAGGESFSIGIQNYTRLFLLIQL
ncbi:MAG: TOBE domain-containing protein [Clostridium sp.]|nr:MAG: TOBE domain-containing protein [Clostridium sp.]